MYAGKIVEQAPARQLFGQGGTVKMRYTRALLDAIRTWSAPRTPSCPWSPAGPRPDRAAAWLLIRAPMPQRADDCVAQEPALTEHAWAPLACWHPCENGVSA